MNYPWLTSFEPGVSTSPSVTWDFWRFARPSCFILPACLRLLVFAVELESSTSERLVPNPCRLFECQSSITSAAAISRCWVYPLSRLTISQKLIEAMGGEVHFYSLGEGLSSTVTFTVPLYQQPLMIWTFSEISWNSKKPHTCPIGRCWDELRSVACRRLVSWGQSSDQCRRRSR
jgi:hypothetical protein